MSGSSIYDLGCSTGTTLVNMNETVAKDVKFIESMGFNLKPALADGVDWGGESYEKEYAFQLNHLAEYYLSKPSQYPLKMLTFVPSCVNAPVNCSHPADSFFCIWKSSLWLLWTKNQPRNVCQRTLDSGYRIHHHFFLTGKKKTRIKRVSFF